MMIKRTYDQKEIDCFDKKEDKIVSLGQVRENLEMIR
jgi:hypothetical protein